MKQHPLRGEVGRLRWFFWGFEHARYNMSYPWRATLLIFAIGPVVHSPLSYTFLVYIGYLICAVLDQMKKDHVYGEEISWELDPDDPQEETLGEQSRVRLPMEYQITVTRVAELLQKMP